MPGQSTTPTVWVAPVRSHWSPRTISWLALAAPATPVTSVRVISDVRNCFMVALLSRARSVREGPDTEIAPDVPPESVEPLRLDDEEEDDEGAEQDEAQVGDDVQHGPRREQEPAEYLHQVADGDGQQGDEDRAEDGAEHRTEAADDDHGQIVDGHGDLELLVVGDAQIVRVEHARHAGIEGRDGEGEQFVAEDVDADDLRGDVVVADGDERAAGAAPHEIHGTDDGEHHEEHQEEVHPALGRDLVAEESRARDLDRGLDAAADPRHVIDGPLDDELAGERGDGEIEPLDPERGDAHHRPYGRGHQASEWEGEPERKAQPDHEVGGGVGAHRHEGAVPDGDLAGIAGQDVEPEGAHHGDRDEVDDGEVVLVHAKGEDDQEQHRRHRDRPARDGSSLLAHTRSMMGLPKIPYGRIISAAIIRT